LTPNDIEKLFNEKFEYYIFNSELNSIEKKIDNASALGGYLVELPQVIDFLDIHNIDYRVACGGKIDLDTSNKDTSCHV